MNTAIENTLCTNTEWIGRSHCNQCHIRRLMLFSELPDSAFEHLLQPIDHFLHSPGSVIYQAATHKKFVYSIRRGMVKLVHDSKDGTNRIVRLLGPGSAIGLELLDGADAYHHAAVAVTKVDLCRIPVSTIRQLEDEYPVLCEHVGKLLQKQLDLADKWIVTLGGGTARQRVAHLLLILHEFFANEDGTFILLNREDMAAMIGIVVETVSRVIADFKRQKIIYKTKDKLYRCNVAALQKLSQQH